MFNLYKVVIFLPVLILLSCSSGSDSIQISASNSTETNETSSSSSYSSSSSAIWNGISGPSQAVAIHGDYAFNIKYIRGLEIYDISANTLNMVSRIEYDSRQFRDLAITSDGNYVIAVDLVFGVTIFDVTDKTSPRFIGEYNSGASTAAGAAITSDDNTVFISSGNNILSLNITDKSNPALLDTFITTDITRGIKLGQSGSKLYVANSSAGLLVLDISNYSSLSSLGLYDTGNTAHNVDIVSDESVAYVADANSGLDVINITNPAAMSSHTVIKYPGSIIYTNVQISPDESTVTLVDPYTSIYFFDITTKSAPVYKGELDHSDIGAIYEMAYYNDNTAYIVGNPSISLINLDNATLSNSTFLDRVLTGHQTTSISKSANEQTLYIVGKSAFSRQQGGLALIDISDSNNPKYKSSLITTSFADVSLTISNDENTAIIASTSGIKTVDLTDKTNPTELDTYAGQYNRIKLSNDETIGYAAAHGTGLIIFNLSNLSSIGLHGFITTNGNAYDIAISNDNNTAYIADDAGGLTTVNISNVATPVLLGNYNTTGNARGIALSSDENTAYIADGTAGLVILDVSDPANPTHISTTSTGASAYKVIISSDGQTAFLTTGTNGLMAMDISNPAAPSIRSSIVQSGWTVEHELLLSNDEQTLYLPIYNGGYVDIDVSDLDNLKLK